MGTMATHRGSTFLRSMSPRRSRHPDYNSGSEDEQPMERRHSSRRMRAMSLRKQKTHELPQDDDESMIAEWGLTKAQEARATGLPLLGLRLLCRRSAHVSRHMLGAASPIRCATQLHCSLCLPSDTSGTRSGPKCVRVAPLRYVLPQWSSPALPGVELGR